MNFKDCIFAKKKYEPINAVNSLTGFTYLPALGDRVMMTSILECYERDNPNEIIYYPPNQLTLARIFEQLDQMYGMKKIFWASDADYDKPHERARIFYIPLEAHQIAIERNIYPSVPVGVLIKQTFAKKRYAGFRYITVHFRNITFKPKTNWKNVPQEKAEKTVNLLKQYIGKHFDKIMLIGNDKPYENEDFLKDKNIIDMRSQFNPETGIPELAWCLQNSLGCIDLHEGGIAHLAAACRIPVFATNYEVDYWKPVVKDKSRYMFFMRGNEFYLFDAMEYFITNVIDK